MEPNEVVNENYEVMDDSEDNAEEIANFEEDNHSSGVSVPMVVGVATVGVVGIIFAYEKAVKPAAKWGWNKVTGFVNKIIAKRKGYVDGEYEEVPQDEEKKATEEKEEPEEPKEETK